MSNNLNLLSPVLIAGVLYGGICLFAFLFQKQMIFFPKPEVELADVASSTFQSGNERLKVWQLNPGNEHALIYFGGNAEAVAYNAYHFSELFGGHTVYLVNYRGFGGSSGSPSERGLYADALNVYDHIATSHTLVDVMGRSIGGSVATYLASHREVEKLLLITPFDSAVNIAKEVYWFLPVSLLMTEKYDAASHAVEVSAKVLIVAAGDDHIVSSQRTEALVEAFGATEVRLETMEETGHNTVQLHRQYDKIIGSFINE